MILELNGFTLVAIYSLLGNPTAELLSCLTAGVCHARQYMQATPWEAQRPFCSDGRRNQVMILIGRDKIRSHLSSADPLDCKDKN